MRHYSRLAAVIAALSISSLAMADQHQHDHSPTEFRQHAAHVHGVGQLDVVIDGDYVMMDLVMPGADIVGFESMPTSPEQEQAVAVALQQLQGGTELFLLPAAAHCRLDIAEADFVLLDAHGHDHDHHHDAHEHDHHHDAHEHEHHHDTDGHAEFHAEYVFQCAYPQQLSYIDVQVFQVFPDNQKLQVRLAAPGGQTAAELHHGHTRLTW